MFCVYFTLYFGDKLPKRYIGSSKIDRVKSGYNGTVKSSKYKSIYINEQLENKHLFKTRILSIHETHQDALAEEFRLQRKYNVVKSNDYMNMSFASVNGHFGRDIFGNNHPFYGKSHNNDSKSKISTTLKQRYKEGVIVSPFTVLDFSGENNGFYGKTHSEETKLKMRKPKSFVPRIKCPCCDKPPLDSGNFIRHMIGKHSWTKDEANEWKSKIILKMKT